jgi:MFS transporter, DHA1 family, inner membrane transport protein
VVLLGATAFVLTPILVSQALHAASGAPTLVTALATSAFNIGNAGGGWLGGVALSTSLDLRGPALTGLVLVLASLVPLALLAAVRPSAPAALSLHRPVIAGRTLLGPGLRARSRSVGRKVIGRPNGPG